MKQIMVLILLLSVYLSGAHAFETSKQLVEAIERDDVALLKAAAINVDLTKNLRTPFDQTNWSMDMTPLSYAARLGHLNVLHALIDLGAPVDGNPTWDNPPLAVAAFYGQVGSIRELYNRGANLNVKSTYSQGANHHSPTPLHCALLKVSNLSAVEMLLKLGADPNLVSTGLLPLSLATVDSLYLDLMFKYKVDPLTLDSYKHTPLFYCYTEICVEKLLQNGVPLNYKSPQGTTALDMAVHWQPILMIDLVGFLRSLGAKLGSELP